VAAAAPQGGGRANLPVVRAPSRSIHHVAAGGAVAARPKSRGKVAESCGQKSAPTLLEGGSAADWLAPGPPHPRDAVPPAIASRRQAAWHRRRVKVAAARRPAASPPPQHVAAAAARWLARSTRPRGRRVATRSAAWRPASATPTGGTMLDGDAPLPPPPNSHPTVAPSSAAAIRRRATGCPRQAAMAGALRPAAVTWRPPRARRGRAARRKTPRWQRARRQLRGTRLPPPHGKHGGGGGTPVGSGTDVSGQAARGRRDVTGAAPSAPVGARGG